MTDHIDLAKRHWKKMCLIVSSWWQKTHFYFHANSVLQDYLWLK
jgi:hypothetical protein